MTAPDTNTFLILVVNVMGYVAVLWKNRISSWQHKKMWSEYEDRHGINGHGRKRTEET